MICIKKEIKDFLDKLEIGKFKLWMGRIQGYLGIMSFSLILYGMAIKNNLFGWSWEIWVTLMIVGIPLLLWFDIKIVCPSELKYGFGLHPKFKEILTETKQLSEKVDKLTEYIEGKKGK